MKKILIYNWNRLDEKDGGGVNVYVKNILKYLEKEKNIDLYYISSGKSYNIFNKKVYYKKVKNEFSNNIKCFEIINSPIMFANNQFNRVDLYNNCTVMKEVFNKFIVENGPFDVIHFNNLEGLSIDVLELKEKYPKTKFIYSMHNYFPICPNVYLWAHDSNNCTDYNDGKNCCNCISSDYNSAKRRMKLLTLLEKIGINVESKSLANIYSKFNKRSTNKEKISNSGCTCKDYKIFREKNIEYLNKYVDSILCVSKRVRDIAIKYGLNKGKCHVSYIGTEFAENLKKPQKIGIKNGFNLLYMGYMNKKKGFDFLVDALLKMDKQTTKKVNLFLVCRNDPKYNFDEIKKKLESKFRTVNYMDGYSHDDIPSILKDKHLGVIPVVWEDNLPQISIEISSYGVPILCSNLGGASELCNSDLFKFVGGDIDDFNRKLKFLIENPNKLNEFWLNYNKPTTMDMHISDLYNYYDIKKGE